MKKKLLAIAVAGAFAAPTVAMAEWSLSGSASQSVSVDGSGISLGGTSGSLGTSGSADLHRAGHDGGDFLFVRR